jgi:RND family efflux transporter MFP subunit
MDAKAWITPFLIIALATLLAAILVGMKPDPEVITPETKPLLVDVLQVSPTSLEISVQAQGVVRPSSQTSLVSEVSGRVMAVSDNFAAGGFFRSGDVLLRLDDRDYQARLKQAQALVAQARSGLAQERGRVAVAEHDWQRRERRNSVGEEARRLALREPQLLEAQAQLESALASLDQARLDLERTVLIAPYDGLVESQQVDIGQYVTAGMSLGSILAVGDAEIRLAIPESKLGYLSLPDAHRHSQGERPKVEISHSLDGVTRTWAAALVRTEGVLDERSRSLFVVAGLQDPYGIYGDAAAEEFAPLRFGMFVDARIEGRRVDGVVSLPRTIIRPGNRVWIVDDNDRLQERELTLLRTDGAEILVTDGLEDGDRVCVTSVGPVLPNTPVSISSVVRQERARQHDAELPGTTSSASPGSAPETSSLAPVPSGDYASVPSN